MTVYVSKNQNGNFEINMSQNFQEGEFAVEAEETTEEITSDDATKPVSTGDVVMANGSIYNLRIL